MDEYESITEAARHRDWQGCARVMFALLYWCTPEQQKNVAVDALRMYVGTWKTKHEDAWQQLPEQILANKTERRPPKFPEFPEDLDPADAEFENALIELYGGAFFRRVSHAKRTKHFATAIRSAVTALQIEKWIRERPDDYGQWKSERGSRGSSFLDNAAAASEAESAWETVDRLLKKQPTIKPESFPEQVQTAQQIASLYADWEESVL